MSTDSVVQPPDDGIDQAFEWVKDVLQKQLRTAEIMDSKATVLFTVGTAIIGAGATVGIDKIKWDNPASFWAGISALIIYVLVVVLSGLTIWPRPFETLDKAKDIESDWIGLPERRFKRLMIEYIAQEEIENEKHLRWKTMPVRLLIPFVGAESVAVICALFFARVFGASLC